MITDGKRHDVRVARPLRFDPGTVVVIDRGYIDFAWFGDLTAQTNTTYNVVERRPVPARGSILRDVSAVIQ